MAERGQADAIRSFDQDGAVRAGAGRERVIGTLCGLLSVVLFSSFTLVSRLGFSSSLTLPDIAALRFGIGGLLLLPVLLRYGLSTVKWRHAAALAFFGGLGFASFAYAGFAMAPAAHGAVLLHGTLPLFTYLILRAADQRSIQRPLGLALIGGGIVLMAYDSVAGASARQLLGDGCLLAASLFWSTYGVLTRRMGLPTAQGASIVAVFSMCCFLPIYACLPGKAILLVDRGELLLQAIVQGVFIGAISIFVYTRAVTALGPARVALFTAAVPCVTTLAAIPLLSETPSAAGLMGVGIVTIGMMVALLPRRRDATSIHR